VRHLVVTVCCFDLKHDSQRHLHIQSHEKTDNDRFFDFRRALRERLRDTESGDHLSAEVPETQSAFTGRLFSTNVESNRTPCFKRRSQDYAADWD